MSKLDSASPFINLALCLELVFLIVMFLVKTETSTSEIVCCSLAIILAVVSLYQNIKDIVEITKHEEG